MAKAENVSLHCSFCRKSQAVVGKLISNPTDYPRAYICDECVAICNSILEDSGVVPVVREPQEPLQKYLNQDVVDAESHQRKLSLVVAEKAADWSCKIVLLGPGSRWKTRLTQGLAEALHVPFTIVDASCRS